MDDPARHGIELCPGIHAERGRRGQAGDDARRLVYLGAEIIERGQERPCCDGISCLELGDGQDRDATVLDREVHVGQDAVGGTEIDTDGVAGAAHAPGRINPSPAG